MKKILIADPNKASLVMTSEIFKDNYPGVQVCVATNSADALKAAQQHQDIDIFIVDFDLPEPHGAHTALELKKISSKPVLITGLDKAEVAQIIEGTLQQHEDCQNWLKKPIPSHVLTAVVDRFLNGKIRTQVRIPCHVPACICTSRTGDPVFYAVVENCSLNGVKLKVVHAKEKSEKIKEGSPIWIRVPAFDEIKHGKAEKQDQNFDFQGKTYLNCLQGEVVWILKESEAWTMGVEFKNQKNAKELFETVATLQSKQNRNCQFQTALKPSRV